MRIYDTLQRAVVLLQPADGRTLTMYSCGPTVYREIHVGNLRTFLMADLVRRTLVLHGTDVRQVQNITDVGHMTEEVFGSGEDRIEVAAHLEGRSPAEIASHYTALFHEDIAAIGILPAHSYPRASEHVPQMIRLIERLIANGHAYEMDGSVYFDTSSFPGYGRLSGNSLTSLERDHRATIDDPRKKHPSDFVLWMSAGPHRLVRFDSPWGVGYPGWHIECSAMSIDAFGEHIDLHTGGEDNVFPHHEDEIAQSEGAVGHEVVRHWIHGAHVLNEGRKMAKSAGNDTTLRELAEQGFRDPLAVRLLFLQSRYRAQMNFTEDGLRGAETALRRWRGQIAALAASVGADPPAPAADAVIQASSPTPRLDRSAETYAQRFRDAIADDLDTPAALRVVGETLAARDLSPEDRASLLSGFDAVLGLDLFRDTDIAIPSDVSELVDARERARAARDFAEADRLRAEIGAHGFDVTDSVTGPIVRPR